MLSGLVSTLLQSAPMECASRWVSVGGGAGSAFSDGTGIGGTSELPSWVHAGHGGRMSRQMQSWRQETQQREGKTETEAKGSCLPRAEGPLTAGGVLPLGAGKKRL